MASEGAGPAHADGFVHPALIYGSDEEFLDVALPFVEEGIGRGEPALVAVQATNAENLRSSLGGEPEGVTILSVEQWYETSARTREKFADWAADHARSGRVRLIGEPPWETGNQAQVRDWARHESVINVAFAGMPVTFICPYDSRTLPPEILEHAHSTHPTIAAPKRWSASDAYENPLDFCRRLNERVKRPSGAPAIEWGFGLSELGAIRRMIKFTALDAGVPGLKAEDLALAVNEITTNAVVHGRPPATLRVWAGAEEVVCEITDAGHGIEDVLAGQLVPPAEAPGGRGLWLARLLCDAVEISTDRGSRVALHVAAGVSVPVPV
jgi:anti-sigma regulatory factor (Ser/Thr protein kinase)